MISWCLFMKTRGHHFLFPIRGFVLNLFCTYVPHKGKRRRGSSLRFFLFFFLPICFVRGFSLLCLNLY